MSALSKYFLEISKHETCANLTHPNETCTQQLITMMWKHLFTCGQFYIPTLVIPLVLKIKSVNREMFIQYLIDYGKSVLIGNWLATISVAGICWFHKIFGKFYLPWFIRVPAAFGTLMFNFYPTRIKRWQTTGLFNMYIETLIKKSNNRIIEFLRKSHVFGTLMFMCFSAVIMTGFKLTGVKRFWFTSMPKPIKDKSQPSKIIKPCVHDGTCTRYIWKEFSTSTELAMIIGLLKFIVSNYKRIKLSQPTPTIKLLLHKLDYNIMAFTISYNTLFKLLYCWFNNRTGENTVKNTMAAGFLSGTAYVLYPIYAIFTYGFTASLELGWLMYSKYIADRINESNKCSQSNRNDFINITNRFIHFVNKKIPILTILMSVSIIQLFQYRFLYPYATPFYVHKFMSQTTAKRADCLGLRASDIFLGFR